MLCLHKVLQMLLRSPLPMRMPQGRNQMQRQLQSQKLPEQGRPAIITIAGQ